MASPGLGVETGPTETPASEAQANPAVMLGIDTNGLTTAQKAENPIDHAVNSTADKVGQVLRKIPTPFEIASTGMTRTAEGLEGLTKEGGIVGSVATVEQATLGYAAEGFREVNRKLVELAEPIILAATAIAPIPPYLKFVINGACKGTSVEDRPTDKSPQFPVQPGQVPFSQPVEAA